MRKLSFSSSPHLAVCISLRESQHRWMSVWCFFHLSNFWLISQLHYADACFRSSTQHSSLCANGLSASLRLGVQLRGDSLISHLAVLFLSCRVIMPEVDWWVRSGLYLEENTHLLKEQTTFAVWTCLISILIVLHCNTMYDMITKWFWNNARLRMFTVIMA